MSTVVSWYKCISDEKEKFPHDIIILLSLDGGEKNFCNVTVSLVLDTFRVIKVVQVGTQWTKNGFLHKQIISYQKIYSKHI